MDKFSNRLKIVLHGCCYFAAISTVEASTILPLIVHYFTDSTAIIGIFTSLLRGGAVIMLLYAAFHTQSYKRVMPFLFRISFFRTIALGSIGFVIFFFGNENKTLVLWLFGLALFSFSFISGFGTIYFNELIGKIFTHNYRSVTLAYRQFFGSLGGIVTGGLASWYLKQGTPPDSFAYIFFVATAVLALGYFALNSVEEFDKSNISERETDFKAFLKNAIAIYKTDKNLRLQVTSGLLSYSYMLCLPFVVIHAKSSMNLGGLVISSAVPIMIGGLLSNLLSGRLLKKNVNKEILLASYVLMVLSLSLALFKPNMISLIFLFFLAGFAIDGFKLSLNNIVLITATEEKRPVYVAIQTNLVNLGLFFAFPGGVLYGIIGFKALVISTLFILLTGLYKAQKIVISAN